MLPLAVAFTLVCVPLLFGQPQSPYGRNLMLDPSGITPNDLPALERQLAQNPEDEALRLRLVVYYRVNAMTADRVRHVFWFIEHHPESRNLNLPPLSINPRGLLLNTVADYEQGKVLWRKQVERQPENGAVLINAAQYIYGSDPFESDKLLLRARRIPAVHVEATNALVSHYSHATFTELAAGVASVHDPGAPGPAYRDHVRALLASTNEAIFPGRVGLELAPPATFPTDSPPHQEVIELYKRKSAHGVQLLQRAQALDPANPEWRVDPASPRPRPVAPAAPSENLPVVACTVAPVYPAAAAQARIQANVRFKGVVGPEGALTNLTLIGGHPLLVEAAQEAAKQSRYPDRVGQTIFIDVPFRLP